MKVKGSVFFHPRYRADIDGLRAVAVLAVVIFHGFPDWLKGGFIGVDIFFVISGYLISTILLNNLESHTFSFCDFYSRRILRIFPALLIVLVACFSFGWVALLSDEYKQLGKHIAAGAGFVSNLVLWNEAGYFDNSAETKPLLHLWSLGVEEQFYIVWPLVLWLAWKRNFNILTVAIIISIASFVLNLRFVSDYPVATFYSPLTRFWELLSGSLLAWVFIYKKDVVGERLLKVDRLLESVIYEKRNNSGGKTLADVISFTGLFTLLFGFWRIDKGLAFPGAWALLPVSGALLIIAAGSDAWVNRKILSNKVVVWFGLISFPLYLWHWPLLAFARIVEGDALSLALSIGAIFLSVALAWLTYRYVERPVRFGIHDKLKVAVLVVFMATIGYVGFNTYERNGLEFRVSSYSKISKAAGEWQYPGNLIPFDFEGRTLLKQESFKKNVTLFVGDSNVEQYYPRVDELIKSRPDIANSVVFATGGGCLPVPAAPYDDARKPCVGLMENAFRYAKNNRNVKEVVIGAQWNGYLAHGAGLNGRFGIGEVDYAASVFKLTAYIDDLIKNGKKVYLLLNIPTGKQIDPKYMVERKLRYFPHVFNYKTGGVSRQLETEKYGAIQQDLKTHAESVGALVVNPLDYLCDSNKCPSLDEFGEPIYKDEGHLRPRYVRYSAGFIDRLLVEE